jgi:MFS family permease
VVIALPIISYLILLSPGQPVALLALAIFLVGISTGSQLKMIVYLTTRYFGMRAFASIFGVLGLSLTLAGGAGPPIGGILYDLHGNYDVLLMLGIPAAVIGAALMLWVGDYPEVREARRLAKAAA